MTQKNKKNAQDNQPEVEAVTGETPAETVENVVSMRAPKGQRKTIFDERTASITERAQEKARLMGEVRQRLAEAKDLQSQGQTEAERATEIANDAGRRLYEARTNGLIDGNEVTAVLGDIFGFKAKQDGSPSKTPDGLGEQMRKRIVRAVAAHDYVNGENVRFFEGLDDETADLVQAEIDKLEGGEIGLWTCYDNIAKIKRDATSGNSVNPAFNPARIAAIVQALSEDGAAERFVDNEPLLDAYTALRRMIDVIGEKAMALQTEAA